MMGGSGGGSSYFPRPTNVEGLVRRAQEEAERERADAQANEFLFDLLARFNDRDVGRTRERLESVEGLLGDDIALEGLLFGGSVAKHTYVDGFSDIDALVLISADEVESPESLKQFFHDRLEARLPRQDVESVEQGRMAVTITYTDGAEIQLLPSLRVGDRIAVPDASGTSWSNIRPEAFRRRLTEANKELGNSLVPAIKLAKSIIANFPEEQQLSGYHVEALAVDAFSGYQDRKTPVAMLRHFFARAAELVSTPIVDITGQSGAVDEYLGASGSSERRLVSDRLATVTRQLRAASTLERWRELLGG